MSTTTSNLGLFEYTSADHSEPFNYQYALNNNWDILDKSIMKGDIISLASSGTLTLTNNRIHKVSASGNITFSLPTGSTSEFKQIVVLLYLGAAYSVTLGTTSYLGASAPSMASSGYYTIIYEYDSIRSGWSVGVLRKA